MYLKTIFIFLLMIFPISISNAQEKTSILLMNFEGIDVTTVFLADVSNGIYDILSKDQNLTIVKKEQVQNVYSDKQVDISKCETIECALFLAKSVNANKVIVGRVAKIGGQFFIEAKIIDVNDDKNFITENIMTTPDKNIKFVIKELAERFSEKLNSFQKGDISGEDTVKNYDEAKKILNTTYKISVGLNGGYNSLMKGYSGYKNNYSSSLDVKFAIFIDNEPTKWAIRISGELFPMELPEGIYGMYEDIFATHINVLYIFFEDGKINPFLGLGGGYYFDWQRVDTLATGEVSKTYTYLGYVATVGVEFKLLKKFGFVSEARLHSIYEPGDYWARNLSYQGGIIVYLN